MGKIPYEVRFAAKAMYLVIWWRQSFVTQPTLREQFAIYVAILRFTIDE